MTERLNDTDRVQPTVVHVMRGVHAKLGVGDRVSAVVKAMRAGLIR